MDFKKLPFKNIARHPGRSALLVSLVAVLAFAMLAGTLMTASLRHGLQSLEQRLGADVIVAPKTAKSTTDLEQVMLDGVPGSFYMDASILDTVAQVEGVKQVSPQYYLATAKAGCCSYPIQIIGIDPKTDFTIQPWIARSYADELGLNDVVVGCDITGAPGTTVRFFGVECRIVAKLDETGTSLDGAAFASAETIRELMRSAVEQGQQTMDKADPDKVVSTVQIKVADGYRASDIADDINLHVRGVWAVPSRSMTSGVADGVSGASRMVGMLVVAVWLLAVAVLVAAFSMTGRQRTREFAVLRVMGASRRMLSSVVITEALMLSVVGAAIGILVALCALVLFNQALESALSLPFLMPSGGTIVLVSVVTFVLSSLVGPLTSALSAMRLSKVDPGQSLREE
ncbi:MAG: ABC transporter permease [Atopobiaceae bacterium]|nr:ABC transporter permease [Atopobiaceae bacterium]